MRSVRNRTDTATIVYRDECDPVFDVGHWTIRDDEVLPLLELLKGLPVAADLDTEHQRILDVLESLQKIAPEHARPATMSVEQVIHMLENLLVKPKS